MSAGGSMAEVLQPKVLQPQWVYLPLGGEVLPLLKRGFLPLLPLPQGQCPWLSPVAVQRACAVGEDSYLTHMQREFNKLPESLRGLLTFDQFLQQAQSKRPQIEAALLKVVDQQQQAEQPDASAWLFQNFFSQPFQSLSWAHDERGLSAIWLGIDRSLLSVDVLPVIYRDDQPTRFRERLMSAPLDQAPLQQYRLLQQKEDVEKQIELDGRRYGLLRLPPKALKVALIGMATPPLLKDEFIAFWRQDFRYQRTLLGQMVWPDGQYTYQFEKL